MADQEQADIRLALARLRQLGYDVGRLEFPLPAKN